MPKMKIVGDCGSVSIVLRGNRYALRWKEGNSWPLKSLGHNDLEVATAEGWRKHDELERAREIERDSLIGRISLAVALDQGLKHAKGQNPRHQMNQKACADRFLKWLDVHAKDGKCSSCAKSDTNYRVPVIQYADQLKPSIVVKFVDHEIERKLATSSIKLTLNVIRLAFNRLNLLDPDTYPLLSIKHPRLVEARVVQKYLEREELEELLANATPEAVAAILLCGFCGLRLTEAAVLMFSDLDPFKNTLNTGTKTIYSERTIPVPEWVMERLLDCVGGGETLAAGADQVCPRSSRAVTPENKIAKAIRESMAICDAKRAEKHAEAMERWRAAGGTLAGPEPKLVPFPKIAPRNMRSTFGTMCHVADVIPEDQRAYMGHRPKTILEKNYRDFKRIDQLRERVVNRIELHFKQPAARVQDVVAGGVAASAELGVSVDKPVDSFVEASVEQIAASAGD